MFHSFTELVLKLVSTYSIVQNVERVAVTERKIRVRTQTQTVLINANFWPCVRCLRLYCASITSGSVPFRSVPFLNVPGFPASRRSLAVGCTATCNLEIAHTCYTSSRLRTHVTQS